MAGEIRRVAIPTTWSELRARALIPVHELSAVDRFGRYFLVGGASTVVDYGIFASLFYLGLQYLAAAAISFVVAVAFNYYWSIRFVFQAGRRSKPREIFLIYIVSGVGIALNLTILAGLVEWAGVHPLIGKLVGSAVILAWNFSARHFWIFAR
jgi:putative flippase GtrA